MYLVDHEQYVLVPLPQQLHTDPEPLSVEGSLAGRCFRQVELQNADDGRRVWVPLLNGLERLGVLELGFPNVQQRAPDEQLHASAGVAHDGRGVGPPQLVEPLLGWRAFPMRSPVRRLGWGVSGRSPTITGVPSNAAPAQQGRPAPDGEPQTSRLTIPPRLFDP